MSMKIVAMITFHEYLSKSTAADDGKEKKESRAKDSRIKSLAAFSFFWW